MEQLISEIEEFCKARRMAPEKLLKVSVGATWGLWQKWKSGEASPTMRVADRVRAYMAANPQSVSPPPTTEDAA